MKNDWNWWPGDSVFDFNGDGKLDFTERVIRDVQHMRMMGLLDDDDDVQDVFHNWNE